MSDTLGEIQYQHFGIIGIIDMGLEAEQYMVIITDRIPVARFPCGHIAYRIQKIDFIKLRSNHFDESTTSKEALKEILKYIEGVKRLFEIQGFYYSRLADITQSMQSKSEQTQESVDSRYQWNEKILNDFSL